MALTQNARLLLISDSVQKVGLGNQRDLVGRFFMEHPHVRAGYIVLTDHVTALGLYEPRDGIMAVLCLSEDAQRRHELLNVSVELETGVRVRESAAGGVPLAIGQAIYRIDHLGEGRASREAPDTPYARCFVRAESAPNPESRVTLAREVDRLGVRRARLVWRQDPLDARTIQRGLEIIAEELGKRKRGRIMLGVNEAYEYGHHMGTTRMSDDPSDGVVDSNARVHGISNLYIAGSSVFPTVGFANPTFTIVAMTLSTLVHKFGNV